jgi:lysozyme
MGLSTDNKLEDMLLRHEGLRLKPYKCTAGKLTIGIGRNLEDNGITEAEARMMLQYDIQIAKTQLVKYKWFTELSDVRKDVIVDMVFNLGLSRFLAFKKTIQLLEAKDYEGAAAEILQSKWASQVGERALELSAMLLTGKYVKGAL